MRKWLVVAVVFGLLAGAVAALRQTGVDLVSLTGLKSPQVAVAAGQSTQPATQRSGGAGRGALPVETAKAVSTQLSDDIGSIGTLLAEETVEIAPETSGRISAILFKDGEPVKAAQPLFQLDTELAKADLAEARARLSLAEATYARNQTLRKSGNVAQSVLEAAETELEMARAAADSTQVRLNKLTVLAPFDGVAGFRSVSVGAYVNAGTALVKLDKIDLLKVSFALPELVQSRISLDQTISLVADALPGETFQATISAIDPTIDVNGRALQVRANLDNSRLLLKPGMLVRITVKGGQRSAVMVPETAILQRGDNAVIFVAHDSKAEEKEVRIGKREAGAIEVLEGIEAGAEVVVAGNTRLNNGAAIEVVAAPAAVTD